MQIEKHWIVCCDCRRMVKSLDTHEWVEMPEMIEALKGMNVSHGYCPECFDWAKRMIEEMVGG